MSSLQKRLGETPLGNPVEHDPNGLLAAPAEQKLCIRWSVLLGYCLVSSLNGFLFMDFSSVQDTAQELFHKDAATVNWLYSVSLITTIPLMMIIWSYNVKYHRSLTWMSAFFNCTGSCIRFVAVKHRHFMLAIGSSVLIGFSSAQVACSASVLSKLWFPMHERTIATSASVMASYSGWLLGALLIPVYINDGFGNTQPPWHFRHERMETVSYWQALFSIVQLVGCLGFYCSSPSKSAVRAATSANSKCGKLLINILGDPWFLIQMFAYSLLSGVSFGLPAVQDAIFTQYNISTIDTAYTNVAFIGAGVLAGLLIGVIVRDPRHFGVTLKILSFIGAASLTALHLLMVGGRAPFLAILLCMSLAGLSSVGFIGIGLEAAAQFPKVGAAASCLSIEWLVQGWGALIAQVATGPDGFLICALAVWVVFLLLLFGFHASVLSDESTEANSQLQDYKS